MNIENINKIKVRGPKDGYDDDQKQSYRKSVWRNLSKCCMSDLSKYENCKVLLLPSKEGIEIDVAISFGIKPSQIIAIDENPAIIAVSKWRKKHPEVKFFGCKLSETPERIKKNGWTISAANLDLCNNFSTEFLSEINGFLTSCPKTENFSFSVTMAKGRESKALSMVLKQIKVPSVFNAPRLGAFFLMMRGFDNHDLALMHEGQYITNRVPMIYAVFHCLRGLIRKAQNLHVKSLIKPAERFKIIQEIKISKGIRSLTIKEREEYYVAREGYCNQVDKVFDESLKFFKKYSAIYLKDAHKEYMQDMKINFHHGISEKVLLPHEARAAINAM